MILFIYDCREKHKSVLFILKDCLMGWKNFNTMKYYHKALHQELQSLARVSYTSTACPIYSTSTCPIYSMFKQFI